MPKVLPKPRSGEAIDLHHKASRAAVERTRIKLGLETIEDVFDTASQVCKRSNDEAWHAFWSYEQSGNCPDWVFDFCIYVMAGRYDIYPEGVKHDGNR